MAVEPGSPESGPGGTRAHPRHHHRGTINAALDQTYAAMEAVLRRRADAVLAHAGRIRR